MAKIYVYDKTSTSISVYLGDLDEEYSRDDRVLTWEVDGTEKSTSIAAYASESKVTTFRGLEPSTRYTVYATVSSGDGDWEFTKNVTTEAEEVEEPDLEPWSWDASNGSATTAQTKQAYYFITNQGKTKSFKYLVWNDIVDKLNSILDATGHTWDVTYATLADTKMTSDDKVLTAERFNSVRNNIRMRYSVSDSEIPLAATGKTVKGSYFTAITDALNGWIGSL